MKGMPASGTLDYTVGDTVKHIKFGKGTVKEIVKTGSDHEVVVDFERVGEKKMFADYHVHTCYSDDSEYLMEDVVRDAISFGMNEICFTDHVDYGIKRDWDDPLGVICRKGGPGEPERMPVANVDYPRYAAEAASLKE